jgi:polysaccharide pyruvyl transferase WcaK-like protein
MGKEKMIGIIGGFGNGNVGDEAVHITIQQLLEKKDIKWKYNTEVFVWGTEMQLNIGNRMHRICTLTDEDYAYINSNFKALIITGGSVVRADWSLLNELIQFKFLDRVKVPIFCFSIGADDGEYDEEVRENIALLHGEAKYFTVRDRYSQEVMKRLGYDVDHTPDVAFAMECSDVEFTSCPEVPIVFSISDWSHEAIDFYANLKKNIAESHLMSFHPSREENMFFDEFRKRGVDQEINSFTATQSPRAIEYAKCVIAGRRHACIFAYLMKVPFIAISYHPKVASVCEDMNWPYVYNVPGRDPSSTKYGYEFKGMDYNKILEMMQDIKPKFIKNPTRKVKEDFDEMYKIIETFI